MANHADSARLFCLADPAGDDTLSQRRNNIRGER